MLIIQKLIIFITLILLPPFIIEFIFFWPPADAITGIGVYLMILSALAAVIMASSKFFGFDLDSLFATDSVDGDRVSPKNHIKKKFDETELASELTEPDNRIRHLIMALFPTFTKPALAKLTLYSDEENMPNEISLSGGDLIRIGRHLTLNDIVISHPTISREHARIFTEKKGFYIEDLNSPGGTYVNKNRLSSLHRHQLHDGDIVNFGPIAYRFEFLEKATEDSFDDTEPPLIAQQEILNGLSLS